MTRRWSFLDRREVPQDYKHAVNRVLTSNRPATPTLLRRSMSTGSLFWMPLYHMWLDDLGKPIRYFRGIHFRLADPYSRIRRKPILERGLRFSDGMWFDLNLS